MSCWIQRPFLGQDLSIKAEQVDHLVHFANRGPLLTVLGPERASSWSQRLKAGSACSMLPAVCEQPLLVPYVGLTWVLLNFAQ